MSLFNINLILIFKVNRVVVTCEKSQDIFNFNKKNIATAENQTKIDCLKGNYADHHSTNYCRNGRINSLYYYVPAENKNNTCIFELDQELYYYNN